MNLTLKTVRETLHAIVNRVGPDFVYTKSGSFGNCYYTNPNDGNHCLVGQVCVDLGIDLPPPGHALNDCGAVRFCEEWLYENDVFVDDDAVELLSDAQDAQDRGVTWADAVYRAEANLDAPMSV